ncbi:hypothetical protein JR316_0013428 [Psilocybe cubensis]|uniref:Uncharacterized protein n=2 Tax=Psilocybe cubensis TaxID=181762 RepID=A0A8H7XJR8_PSICU|nr:uncharacterized protein JR316_0013428 [Psilocybe cubensis]KAH9474265.1 hypothetical protein JR316_0013428 [Psilocybe cubensis]
MPEEKSPKAPDKVPTIVASSSVIDVKSFIPVYDALGNLISYIENSNAHSNGRLSVTPAPMQVTQSQPTVNSVPSSAAVQGLSVSIPGIEFTTSNTWDGWPDGDLELDFTHQEYAKTGNLTFHWAFSTSGGRRNRSVHAEVWQNGHQITRKCLGIIVCLDPTCQMIIRPQARKTSRDIQCALPCHCGLERKHELCSVESVISTWKYGVHFSNHGTHTHRRPTHILHILPGQRQQFEAIVESHPKSGPLALVMGVPTLNGPGESVADITPVLLNADRVGKERRKFIKGSLSNTHEQAFASFAKFHEDHEDSLSMTLLLSFSIALRQAISIYGNQKTIYTYDGQLYGGHPKVESKAKFAGFVSGKNISLPDGYGVIYALYCLRGGTEAQERFYDI